MGVFLEVSDDRTLTNLTLKEGYRTVYQYTSLVYTDAPLQVKKLFKQQLRWARGSQYNTLRMLPVDARPRPHAGAVLRDGHHPAVHARSASSAAGSTARSPARATTSTRASCTSTGSQPGFVYVVALMVLSSRAQHGHPADAAPRREAERLLPPADLHHRVDVLPHADPPHRLLPPGHASGWGTRAGAYAGGPMETEPVAARRHRRTQTPVSPIDRVGPRVAATRPRRTAPSTTCSDAPRRPGPASTSPPTRRDRPRDASGAAAAAAAASALTAPTTAARRAKARRYNPYAAIPY